MMRAMPEIMIRLACPDDAEAMADIYRPYVLTGTETFETVPPPASAFAEKIAHCAAKGWPFLVACGADEVLGYAYATQFRDRDAYRYACENSIYVKGGQLGRGIGRQLLGALIDAAEASGFRQMIAVISGIGPASPALHAAHGFTDAGRMQSVGRKLGRWLDTRYMQRALGPGDKTSPDA
jgi:phosphinothricin acetyltransferase